MKLKGITVGTYISKRPKGKFDESICASCENNKNKNIDKEKQYELCKGCDKFYVSKMDSIYKGILKNYSVQLADTLSSKVEEIEIFIIKYLKV